MYGYRGNSERRAKLWDWDKIYPLLYVLIKWISNKNLLYSTGNSSQYSVMTYMGKESKEEWTCVCVISMPEMVKNLPAMQETWVRSLRSNWRSPGEGNDNPLILAWRIPWTEEPGGLQSMGSQRVGHDCATCTTQHNWFNLLCMRN